MSYLDRKLIAAHLTASPFFGGPERQMVGLACAMGGEIENAFLCLMENGKAKPFIDELRRSGHNAVELKSNYPHLLSATREVARHLHDLGAHVLLTHGYKADIIGLLAARLAGIPVVMVSRGWTYATRRVRVYERLDRLALRLSDHVVCVSEGQAKKVRKAGVRRDRVEVIRNSIDISRFARANPAAEKTLRALVPCPVRHIVLAVGRLSPEKGFDYFVEAARLVCAKRNDVGFAILGDGPLKADLQARINSAGLQRQFILCGFRKDVDQLLPHASVLVQSSHTEGMPNVVLEAMAACVPVVATSVGGTPELIVHGESGYLVPPADAEVLAEGMLLLLGDSVERAQMACAARRRVEEQFSFAAQAASYEQMFGKLLARRHSFPNRNMELAHA